MLDVLAQSTSSDLPAVTPWAFGLAAVGLLTLLVRVFADASKRSAEERRAATASHIADLKSENDDLKVDNERLRRERDDERRSSEASRAEAARWKQQAIEATDRAERAQRELRDTKDLLREAQRDIIVLRRTNGPTA